MCFNLRVIACHFFQILKCAVCEDPCNKKIQFTCIVSLGKCDASCKVDNSSQRCQNWMRESGCGQKEQKLGIVLQSILMSPLKKKIYIYYNQLTDTKLCCFLLFLDRSTKKNQSKIKS